jgi:T5SS/PEP-CTERM-associated repeat protein
MTGSSGAHFARYVDSINIRCNIDPFWNDYIAIWLNINHRLEVESKEIFPNPAGAVSAVHATQAQIRSLAWTGADGTAFGDAKNWNDLTNGLNPAATAPGTADVVSIATSGTISGTGTVADIYFSGAPRLAGKLAVSDQVNLVGMLTIAGGASLTAPNFNAYTASDLVVLAGGAVNVPGTNAGGFINAVQLDGTLLVNGGRVIAGGQVNFGVTASAAASITVEAGGTLSGWAMLVANAPGVTASLLVTGAKSVVTVPGGPVLGSQNAGGYFVVGGGYPNGSGSAGSVMVTAGGLLDVGGSSQIGASLGSGAATVSSSGTWETNGLYIGGGSGGPGTVTVASKGWLEVSTALQIGGGTLGGSGLLSITAGGTVSGTAIDLDNGFLIGGFSTGAAGGTLALQGAGALLSAVSANASLGAGSFTIAQKAVADLQQVSVGTVVGGGALLIASGGTLVTSGGFDSIGNQAGATSSATVTGTGSRWTTGNYLVVGNNGGGSLTIAAGGIVQAADSIDLGDGYGSSGTLDVAAGGTFAVTGQLNIAGYGGGSGYASVAGGHVTISGAVDIGWQGFGTLAITAGGTVTNGDTWTNVGDTNGGGQATIDGAGSTWNLNAFTVGYQCAGTLTISNGGVLNVLGNVPDFLDNAWSSIGWTADASGSLVTVTGKGSKIAFNGALSVAGSVGGELDVMNGALVSFSAAQASNFDSIIVANRYGGAGTVHVYGGTIEAGSNDILVGLNGAGTFDIASGGRVDATGGMVVAVSLGSSGVLNVDGAGSTLTVGRYFVIGGGYSQGGQGLVSVTGSSTVLSWVGVYMFASGTLQVDGLSKVEIGTSRDAVAGSIVIDAGFTLAGAGTISGNLDVLGTFEATGGLFQIYGNVVGAGTLQIAQGGTLAEIGAIGGTGILSILAGGVVALAAGDSMTEASNDAGTLLLTGGIYTTGSLAIVSGGTVTGYGAVGGHVVDAGLIDAVGGILNVSGLAGLAGGTWSGGGLRADANAALQYAGDAPIATDAGTVILSGVASVIQWFNVPISQYVAIDTSLSTIAAGGTLALLNGRTFMAVASAGTFSDAGTLLLSGSNFGAASLVLAAGATVGGAGTITGGITLAGAASIGGGPLTWANKLSGSGTLNILAGATLLPAGGISFAGTLVDSGVVQLAGATLADTAMTIAAAGTITGFGTVTGGISGPGVLDAAGGTLAVGGIADISAGTLTGGTIEADAGSVLQLANNTVIATDAGGITLSGTGSVIEALNTTKTTQVAIDSTLAAIASAGTLALLNGRAFTAAAAPLFTDGGVLDVEGSSFKATKLTIAATGTLIDAGTVTASILNAGLVSIADDTTLTLTGGGALGGTFAGAGTLQLVGAKPFTLTAGTTLTADLVQVAGSSTLSGTGTIASPLDIAGSVIAAGGTLTLDGSLTGSGTLTVAAGAMLQLADGGTFFGTVNGAGAVMNDDFIAGMAQGLALSGAGTLSVSNAANAEISAGNGDGVVLAAGTDVVVNAGNIDGSRHGLVMSGTSATVTNSGLVAGDTGAAILASGPGAVAVVNTGLIVNYEGTGVPALSLNGVASATVTNAGTIIGGAWLGGTGSAIQFGPGSDQLIVLPGAVFVGTVRGGLGANTLELATPTTGTAVGTLSGIGPNFTGFANIVEDSGAAWVLAATNSLAAGGAMTLAANATLTLSGSLAEAAGASIGGAGTFVIGAGGTLQAMAGNGSNIAINAAALSNQGLLDVTTGGTLTLGAAAFSNLSGGTLTGGAFEVDGTGILQLPNNAAVKVDNACIVLNGGTVQWKNTGAGTTQSLAQTLGTIGTAGTLAVQSGVGFAVAGTLTVQGRIELTDATLSGATLAVAAAATVIGSGTISGAIADNGLVEASGGSLTLANAMTGAGTIGIDANSVLTANGSIAAAALTFLSDDGTLALLKPSLVSAAIAGFAPSDNIDLIGVAVTSVTFVGNTLTLTGTAGVVGSLTFVGDYTGYHFGHFADGNGGTNIVLI